MTQLPLKLRVDIRDRYDDSKSNVQKAFAKVKDVVGCPIDCHLDWTTLWMELEKTNPDKTTFVASIAHIVQSWSEALISQLEDDSLESWTEEFVEKVETGNKISLHVLTSDIEKQVKTAWLNELRSAVIRIPKQTLRTITISSSKFNLEMETFFSTPANNTSSTTDPDPLYEDDEWSTSSFSVAATPTSSVSGRHDLPLRRPTTSLFPTGPYPDSTTPSPLPAISSLSRPDLLFSTLTPHLIQMTVEAPDKVRIQESLALSNRVTIRDTPDQPSRMTLRAMHEPSLRLVQEYFQRWTRRDERDVRKVFFKSIHPLTADADLLQSPILVAMMHASNLGVGTFHDTLVIDVVEPSHLQRHVMINPALVQAFIEGVLGYELVNPAASTGRYWEFRRVRPFA